jgi:glycine/D-amino acid oxidase-like deaminating enzyme/glycine cleavage system aminomethyltransferase T
LEDTAEIWKDQKISFSSLKHRPYFSTKWIRFYVDFNLLINVLMLTLLRRRSKNPNFLKLLSTTSTPLHAQVVVIGGGIIGNSVAYHLGKLGVKDVVLLEQSQLTAGTTWHAAGLMVTYGSLSETSTEIRKYSKKLYSTILEEETGQSTGFKPVGFIELAADKDRLEEYRRVAAFNRKCGVEVHEIGPKDVQKLFPLCKTEDIIAGFYVKDDGRVNPVDVTMALARGAKMNGVKIFENTRVSHVLVEPMIDGINKRVKGVQLENGTIIHTENIVNCAGMWARQLGEKNGVLIPNQAAEHYYLVTDAMPEVDPNWPVIEDPANYTYIRPEAGGLMVGLFEGKAASWKSTVIPKHFAFGEIEPDYDRMGPYLEAAMSRVPKSIHAGIKKFFCGPESFTPDLAPIVGEAPEIRNYYVLAGLNSIGILSAGGIGRLLAHWIVHKQPDMDVTGMNIHRFQSFQNTQQYREQRVTETLGLVYKCHYPYKTKQTARGTKRSPFYLKQKELGAYFKDVSGWESPDFFIPPTSSSSSSSNIDVNRHTWQRYDWFPIWKQEHDACRSNVIIMDMSFMSKFLIKGKDAAKALNYLCTANIDTKPGWMTYTQMLNHNGKMEADITVTKLPETVPLLDDSPSQTKQQEEFLVIVTDTMHRHVHNWFQRHIYGDQGDRHVSVTDVTSSYAQLNIQGPNSRKLMQKLISNHYNNIDNDSEQQLLQQFFNNDHFPYRSVQYVNIRYARILVARITYLGELGYELHIPTEHALDIYEYIMECGKEFNLQPAGLKALASLRLEKAYRDYGHDIDNTDTLLEVGTLHIFMIYFGSFKYYQTTYY